MAASTMLVLTSSIIAFTSGCSMKSLYIILLALANDISMVPVAYDNADATAKPRLPNTSTMLVVFVILACIACSLLAVYVDDLGLLLWIWLFNIGTFTVVDIGKIQFRKLIGDSYGDIIESDELIVLDEKKTEVEQHQEMKMRYDVHRDSIMVPSEFEHSVEWNNTGSLGRDGATDGIVSFRQPGARLQRLKIASAPELNFH